MQEQQEKEEREKLARLLGLNDPACPPSHMLMPWEQIKENLAVFESSERHSVLLFTLFLFQFQLYEKSLFQKTCIQIFPNGFCIDLLSVGSEESDFSHHRFWMCPSYTKPDEAYFFSVAKLMDSRTRDAVMCTASNCKHFGVLRYCCVQYFDHSLSGHKKKITQFEWSLKFDPFW